MHLLRQSVGLLPRCNRFAAHSTLTALLRGRFHHQRLGPFRASNPNITCPGGDGVRTAARRQICQVQMKTFRSRCFELYFSYEVNLRQPLHLVPLHDFTLWRRITRQIGALCQGMTRAERQQNDCQDYPPHSVGLIKNDFGDP